MFTRALAAWDLPPGRAIDVGFGDGTETAALLAGGWSVLAIDPEPAAAEHLLGRLDPAARARLQVVTAPLESASLPAADLVYAGFSLPFVPPGSFDRAWSAIRASLRSRGILAADFFGPNDSWATDSTMTNHDRAGIERLTEGLDVVDLAEAEQDGAAFSGPKHWHVFSLVARVPDDG
ncbi:MAG TPA: class I SAM-dependent methyltransferase [Candidatus Limnocylindrales bacterium]|nr:class I SAM-dependent methyltransferase [Candidatus Limnocylindrales bacterium]